MSEPWKEYERSVVRYGQEKGFPAWERRLRGGSKHDLLDLDGTIPDGWMIGCKSVHRGVTIGRRLSEAMDQCHRAIDALDHYRISPEGIIPVQILQRPGSPIGAHYVVTEFDWFLQLAIQRQKWEKQ